MTKEEEIAFLENSITDDNVLLDALDDKIKKLKSEYNTLENKIREKKNNLYLLKK